MDDIDPCGFNMSESISVDLKYLYRFKNTKKNMFFLLIRSSELKEYKKLDLLSYRNISNEENVMNSQKYVFFVTMWRFSNKCNNEKKAFTPDEINLIKKLFRIKFVNKEKNIMAVLVNI